MFPVLALRISQKAFIGSTQCYGYALPICWCRNDRPSKNLVNKKNTFLTKENFFFFYNYKKNVTYDLELGNGASHRLGL